MPYPGPVEIKEPGPAIGTPRLCLVRRKQNSPLALPSPLAAISNLKKICKEYSAEQYHLEVIDLAKNPSLASNHQILAIPTLVRSLPVPIRKIIGDLSDTERVVVGLNISPSSKAKKQPSK